MGKHLYITEKPSVAASFATVLGMQISRNDRQQGYAESSDAIVTWCYGHLVTMSYPDAYNPEWKRWRAEHLPIIPQDWKYEVIGDSGNQRQFHAVKALLNREDVDMVYACTDSGREGEYIFRLVYMMSGSAKPARRVWISAQTEEAVKRGISEAKDIHAYDALADAAYCRAKEDWLFGMNFSRLYTCQYGRDLANHLKEPKSSVIAIGRVMTCVLGLVVDRELEIRHFVPKMQYGVTASFLSEKSGIAYSGKWVPAEALEGAGRKQAKGAKRATKKVDGESSEGVAAESGDATAKKGTKKASKAESSEGGAEIKVPAAEEPVEDRTLTREEGEALIERLSGKPAMVAKVEIKPKSEPPPMLFNLAELQSEANRRYKMPVDRTLEVAQSLYEKKLISYPRTDSRVLSTEVLPELPKILNGLFGNAAFREDVVKIKQHGGIKVDKSAKRFVDDSKVTDHYAIIPTYVTVDPVTLDGDGEKIYRLIVKRFLAIFYPPAVYNTVRVETLIDKETFVTNARSLKDPGWKALYGVVAAGEPKGTSAEAIKAGSTEDAKAGVSSAEESNDVPLHLLVRKESCQVTDLNLEEKETRPPQRFTDGSLILVMEKAGKYIENEELREQLKTSGIGTSATRASIIKKLTDIGHIHIQPKTQIVTPTTKGEAIVKLVRLSAKELLNPSLTASWEKGLFMIQNRETTQEVFQQKLNGYIIKTIGKVKHHGDAGRRL